MKRWSVIPLSLLAIGLLAGCLATTSERGYRFNEEAVASIKPGETTREQVTALLGSPSSSASFGQETWYYIGSTVEGVAFLTPEVKAQHVLEVTFDGQGMVESLKRYNQNDSRMIAIRADKTPTEGNKMSPIEQVLGNLGRFNKSPTSRD